MSSRSPNRPSERPHKGAPSSNSQLTTHNSKLCFVCVGAGRGTRFDGDKLAEPLAGTTVFGAALRALTSAFQSTPLVVVVAPDRLSAWRAALGSDFPEALFVAGGEHRHDSVRAGVRAAAELGAEIVAVHDAARPLVDRRDIRSVVRALGGADSAILVAPVNDTVKRVGADGSVVETLNRRDLRLALTPQVFRIASLVKAWTLAGLDGEWPDESSFLEQAGFDVRSVVARHPNPKLTTGSDLRLMRCLHEAKT